MSGETHGNGLTSSERVSARLTSILPLVVVVSLSLQPVFFGPPPNRLFLLPGLAWGSIGVVLAWRARSGLAVAFALLVFTLPGVLGMLFAPAIVLFVLNGFR